MLPASETSRPLLSVSTDSTASFTSTTSTEKFEIVGRDGKPIKKKTSTEKTEAKSEMVGRDGKPITEKTQDVAKNVEFHQKKRSVLSDAEMQKVTRKWVKKHKVTNLNLQQLSALRSKILPEQTDKRKILVELYNELKTIHKEEKAHSFPGNIVESAKDLVQKFKKKDQMADDSVLHYIIEEDLNEPPLKFVFNYTAPGSKAVRQISTQLGSKEEDLENKAEVTSQEGTSQSKEEDLKNKAEVTSHSKESESEDDEIGYSSSLGSEEEYFSSDDDQKKSLIELKQEDKLVNSKKEEFDQMTNEEIIGLMRSRSGANADTTTVYLNNL